MAFTESERADIFRFLGYPYIQSVAASFHLGFPAVSQPMYLLDAALTKLAPEGEQRVRHDLCELLAIESQLSDARSRFKASSIGELEMNPRETAMLRNELLFWQRRLADDTMTIPNPYSQMDYLGMPGGVNGKVSG